MSNNKPRNNGKSDGWQLQQFQITHLKNKLEKITHERELKFNLQAAKLDEVTRQRDDYRQQREAFNTALVSERLFIQHMINQGYFTHDEMMVERALSKL